GRLHDVLEAIGHAVQRTSPRSRGDLPIRRRGVAQRAFRGYRDEGFEVLVQRRDAVEKGAGNMRRGDLAGADAPAEIDGTEPDQLVIGHVITPGGRLTSRSAKRRGAPAISAAILMQASWRPGCFSSSGGTMRAQASLANGQRVWREHPDGWSIGLGISPLSASGVLTLFGSG